MSNVIDINHIPIFDVDSQEKEEVEEEEVEERGYLDILKMNQPEWLYIFVGCIFAGILGVAMPAFAILFSEVIAVSRSANTCVGRKQWKHQDILLWDAW